MSEKKTVLDSLYFVNKSNRRVALEIITGGPGQTSSISVKIDDLIDIGDIHGNLPETIIGDNKTLNGKYLIIACSISDTSREINHTEMRIRLTGGIIFMEYPLFAKVDNEGDTVDYLCIIEFYNPS